MAPVQSRHLLSYENLVHAISGAAGSVFAMSSFYPLDTVRCILQIDEKRKSKNTLVMLMDIMTDGGISSLYKGLLPVLVSVCASNFVYFYTFHGLKAFYGTPKNQNAARDLLLACLAASVNVLSTTPLWVVTTRLKLQGTKLHSKELTTDSAPLYNGLLDGLIKVYKKEGAAGLWSSTLPSLILVLNPGIQYMVYETLKRQIRGISNAQDLNAFTYFCIGAWAKAIATVVTYPIQLIQSKFRYGNKDNTKQMGILETISHILRTQGIQGLFKGLEAKLLQTVLTAALMLVCYEKIAAFVFRILRAQGRSVLF
uniref:Peroxisomal membrane protein PMP34 n=1 Tax=Strigamia maritima TaxID=126957 RepID=T1IIK0_STRMM